MNRLPFGGYALQRVRSESEFLQFKRGLVRSMSKVASTWGLAFAHKVTSKKWGMISIAFMLFLLYMFIEGHVSREIETSDSASSQIYSVVWFYAGHLIRDLSISFVVAAIVTFFIETVHRQHLDDSFQQKVEAISNNVFNGVFNTHLPNEYVHRVVEEMLKVKLIRSNFNLTYTVSDASVARGDGTVLNFVTVEADARFRVKNISQRGEVVPIKISLPNPFTTEMKRFVDISRVSVNGYCRLTQGHESQLQYGLADDFQDVTVDFGFHPLPPGEEAEFHFIYTMAKKDDDTETFRTAVACDNIKVQIFNHSSRGLEFHADGIRKGDLKDEPPTHNGKLYKWETNGYVLPARGIIFWWKRRPTTLHLTSVEPTSDERTEELTS